MTVKNDLNYNIARELKSPLTKGTLGSVGGGCFQRFTLPSLVHRHHLEPVVRLLHKVLDLELGHIAIDLASLDPASTSRIALLNDVSSDG